MSTLGQILDGDEEAVEVEAQAETEVVETEPTGVKEPEAEAVQAEAEPEQESSPEPDSSPHVPLSAVHGERDRRQAAEKERDDLRKQLEAKNTKEPTSVFEDEKAFASEIKSDFNQTLTNHTLNQSEFFAEREYGKPQLAAKIETFKSLVESNPQYRDQFINAVSPYHELVTIVDNHTKLEQMQDLPAYEAKLRAEIKAEVEAENAAKAKSKADLRESIPDSLARTASSGGLTASDWGGPTSLDSLID